MNALVTFIIGFCGVKSTAHLAYADVDGCVNLMVNCSVDKDGKIRVEQVNACSLRKEVLQKRGEL